MSIPANNNRPIEGKLLKDVLTQLMRINALASRLKVDLEPLSAEEKAVGAEPMTKEQIDRELDSIRLTACRIALHDLRATKDEWCEAMAQID